MAQMAKMTADRHSARKPRRLPLLGIAAALTLALPSTGLAVVGLSDSDSAQSAAFDWRVSVHERQIMFPSIISRCIVTVTSKNQIYMSL